MIHATDKALDKLEPLLQEIRQYGALQERSRGVFYFKSKAFLHFHEDPSGLFADIRVAYDFERLPVSDKKHQSHLLECLNKALSSI
jgi:hypothetical protein